MARSAVYGTQWAGVYILVLTVVLTLSVTGTLHAQAGQASVPFLKMEPDARATALGNTGVARPGFHSSFWNPAMLAFQGQSAFSLSHANLLSGLEQRFLHDAVSISAPLGRRSGFSADLTYMGMGEQMAMNSEGTPLGSFRNYDFAAGFSYGFRPARYWSFGMGLTYIQSSSGAGQVSDGLTIDTGRSWSFSAGTLYRSRLHGLGRHRARLHMGASVSHLGEGMRYMEGQQAHSLPSMMRAGMSYEMLAGGRRDHRFIFSSDVAKALYRMEEGSADGNPSWSGLTGLRALTQSWKPLDTPSGTLSVAQQLTAGMGLEYWYQDLFALRSGYYYEHPDNGDRRYITSGAGLRYDRFAFDVSYGYAVTENHPNANTLRFSLQVMFGPTRYLPEPRRIAPVREPVLEELLPPMTPLMADMPTARELSAPLQDPEPLVVPDPIGEVEPVDWIAEYGEPFARKLEAGLAHFRLMSSELDEVHKEAVALLTDTLVAQPSVDLIIRGYADASGTDPVNELVSEARARSIWLALVRQGIEADRILIETGGVASPDAGTREHADRFVRDGVPTTTYPYEPEHRKVTLEFVYDVPRQAHPLRDMDIRLKHTPGEALLSGGALRFRWLAFEATERAEAELNGLMEFLEANPGSNLQIVHIARFPQAGRAFVQELTRARAEKVMAYLLQAGISPDRIEVVSPEDTLWQELITDTWERSVYAEQTIVIVVP